METSLANRMHSIPKSLIREMLQVTEDPSVISFAGGMPNPKLFPTREIAEAAAKVIGQFGQTALQYSTTPGYLPLREYIAQRYQAQQGLQMDPAQILITNGSQQALDPILFK